MADIDMVNNPPHYQGCNGLECIDVIEAFALGFNLGNVVKYILRAGKKGYALTDLKKAAWYLAREIQVREGHTEAAQCPATTDRGSKHVEHHSDQ